MLFRDTDAVIARVTDEREDQRVAGVAAAIGCSVTKAQTPRRMGTRC
jgi:hypothetical protein